MRVAIVGSGIVGSYVYSNCESLGCEVDMFDCGNAYLPQTSELGGYNGLSKGRRFGLYGTAPLWGGQFNFISDQDLQDIKDDKGLIDGIKGGKTDVLNDFFKGLRNIEKGTDGLTKTGFWLWPWKRNVAKRFLRNKNVINETILSIEKNDGQYSLIGNNNRYENYERVYLCAGAFESNRILVNSGLAPKTTSFIDHLSAITHKVILNKRSNFLRELKPKIGYRGLITSRYIIRNGYVHLLFNNEIQIFSIIKKYIFKLERQVKVNSWIQEFKFLFYFPLGLVLGHFYVDRNAALALDIDNCGGLITESDGITRAIWTIDEKTLEIFRQEQKKITDQLLREGVRFDTVEFKSEKFTDTFHPTGINDQLIKNYSDCEIIGYEGLHVFSTGVLPGGYSSNPTASVLALVKSHFNAI